MITKGNEMLTAQNPETYESLHTMIPEPLIHKVRTVALLEGRSEADVIAVALSLYVTDRVPKRGGEMAAEAELLYGSTLNLSIDQQTKMKGQSFIIRNEDHLDEIFGIDLVFDGGDNFRAYVQAYHRVSGHTHKRVGKQRMYNHEEVVFAKSIGFDLTKREDPAYLEALALDVANTYVMDLD